MEPNDSGTLLHLFADAVAVEAGQMTEGQAIDRAMRRMEEPRLTSPHWLDRFPRRCTGWGGMD